MSFLSSKTKRNIQRIIPFGVIWLVLGWVFLFVEYAATDHYSYSSQSAIRLDTRVLIFASTAVAMAGLLVGALEVYWLNNLFAKKSFGVKIFYKTLIYAFILFVIISVAFPIAASLELDVNFTHDQVWEKYINFLQSTTFYSTAIQMGVSLDLSLFYFEISESVGHRIIYNFFAGKYHKPIVEQRIFMFLDMKSSTTIAEKLGHQTYFNLLKDYYDTLSDAIIKHEGEVYQYVGDEIVVSWEFLSPKKNARCINCFFAMKEKLNHRRTYFEKKYGEIPDFKAGIHFGEVTAGEIGTLQKAIAFTGDVLNTTSRIQGKCNELGAELLVSGKLLKNIEPNEHYAAESLGAIELRGKENLLEVCSISKKS